MRAFIVTTFVGCFGVTEKNKIISFVPFPKDPEEIAEKLRLSESEIIEEEKKVQSELWNKNYREFVYPVRKHGVKHAEPGNKVETFVKENLRKIAIEESFVKDQIEFNQLFTKINLELTKVRIKKAIGRDKLIIQVNGTIEELDKTINIFIERLRELYGLHFPEMDRAIKDHEKFVKIVNRYGSKDRIEDIELKHLAEKSIGMDLKEEDVRSIQMIAEEILELYKLRDSLTKYLDKLVKDIAPNFTELAGAALAAKFIAKAGGIDKLAKAASSTVQLLGSEKALFRYLHGHGKSPKYGILFSHSLIQNSPQEHRGKIARTLAAKLSIAAKMDFYSKEYKGDKLKKELEERVKEILSSK